MPTAVARGRRRGRAASAVPSVVAALVLGLLGPALPPAAGPARAAEPAVARVAGSTRVDTAVEVSRRYWTDSRWAVLATAATFADALGGTALAARLGAPLLLVDADRLPEAVADELDRLGVRDVVLLGGPEAVSEEVEVAVAALPGAPEVTRVGGAHRWQTAARTARATLDGPGSGDGGQSGGGPGSGDGAEEVVLAYGHDFPDALAAGALPGDPARVPVLLSARDALPPATEQALLELAPERVVLVGGPAALDEAVGERLDALGLDHVRLHGRSRFETSSAVLAEALDRLDVTPRPLVVATATAFPDALPAAALAARLDGVLLLVPPTGLTDGQDALLRFHRARLSSAVVVGGHAALGPHVDSEVAAALAGTPRPTATVVAGGYRGVASPLPDDVAASMTGVSWRPGCPVGLADLALLELTHRTLDGGTATGRMVVHAEVARDVLEVFAALYRAAFPVERMRLVDVYGGDDDASMAANNTSAFNCRTVAGTTRWSEHAYGRAIDVNPVQNPYVTASGRASPPAGSAYLDRGDVRPGMVVDGDAVVAAFARAGWGWGGHWSSVKDYQHFSTSGR